MKTAIAAFVCLAALCACAKQESADVNGPVSGATASAPALTKGKAASGLALARAWCASCHAVEMGGAASDMAPTFAAIAERRDDTWIKGWLADPHPPMEGITLSNQEIADLTAYIKSLAP